MTRIDVKGVERYVKGGSSVENQKAKNSAYYSANREKERARNIKYHLENSEKVKTQKAMFKYGEDKRAMWNSQNGICPICTKPLPTEVHSRNCHVDHDHSKPKGQGTRGLVHGWCNTHVIAVCENNPDDVRRAFAYLQSSTHGRDAACTTTTDSIVSTASNKETCATESAPVTVATPTGRLR